MDDEFQGLGRVHRGVLANSRLDVLLGAVLLSSRVDLVRHDPRHDGRHDVHQHELQLLRGPGHAGDRRGHAVVSGLFAAHAFSRGGHSDPQIEMEGVVDDEADRGYGR